MRRSIRLAFLAGALAATGGISAQDAASPEAEADTSTPNETVTTHRKRRAGRGGGGAALRASRRADGEQG